MALARVTMRSKQHLACLRVFEQGLVMETMHYPKEIRHMDLVWDRVVLTEAEMTMARQLIDNLARPFEPEKYRDELHEQMALLIESRVTGETYKVEAPSKGRKVVDLMEALRASIAQTEKEKGQFETNEASIESKEAVIGDKRAVVGDKRAVAGDKKAMAGDKRAVTGDNGAVAGEKSAMAGDKRVIAADKGATVGDMELMAENKELLTEGNEAGPDQSIGEKPKSSLTPRKRTTRRAKEA